MRHVSRKHNGLGDEQESKEIEDDKKKVKCSQCRQSHCEQSTLRRHIKHVHLGVILACGMCDTIRAQLIRGIQSSHIHRVRN